ncbi:MAG: hypothetical protein ACM37V_00370 [Gemmatimonadota bacterium]
MRRLAVLLTALGVACGGGGSRSQVPAPATMNDALSRFLEAAQTRDIQKMGQLWGTARGPAVEWMPDSTLQMRLTVVQRYLGANGYRVVEGPLAVPGHADRRLFRVELQRAQCVHVQPIELIQARRGGWLVYDVHLESANEVGKCPAGPGTRP